MSRRNRTRTSGTRPESINITGLLNSLLGEDVVNSAFAEIGVPGWQRDRPSQGGSTTASQGTGTHGTHGTQVANRNTSSTLSSLTAWPIMNVVERNGATELEVEVPGMSPDDIQLELKENNLIISGERTEEKKEDSETRHVYERRYGSFTRTIPVYPGVNIESITASYTNGVLYVTVPQPPEQRGQRIQIQS